MVMLPVLMSIVVLYDVDCSILTVVFAAEQRIAQEKEPPEPDRGEEAACSRSRRLIAETSSLGILKFYLSSSSSSLCW